MIMSPSSLSLSKTELQQLMNLLADSEEGRIRLVNLFISKTRRLVNVKTLRSFLIDCISQYPANAFEAVQSFQNVCYRDNKYSMILEIEVSKIDTTITLATIIDSWTFLEHYVGRPRTTTVSVFPGKPRSRLDRDEELYRIALERLLLKREWYDVTGSLGRRKVWFTDESNLMTEFDKEPPGTTDATKARDILGLIHFLDDSYLLIITLSVAELVKVGDVRIARPSVADGGNSRFAAYLKFVPRSIYDSNWGATVNLRKLRTEDEFYGAPERLCSPIPLSSIGDAIDVEALGWVVGSRGHEIGIDDNESFQRKLSDGKELRYIQHEMLKLANAP